MTDNDPVKSALEQYEAAENVTVSPPKVRNPDDPNNLWVMCEICYEVIAIADKRTLQLPLKAEMFDSPFPGRGSFPPWQPGTDYEFMLCPHCGYRFAVEENRIRTQDGFYAVPETIQQEDVKDGEEEGVKDQDSKGPEGNGKKEKVKTPANKPGKGGSK